MDGAISIGRNVGNVPMSEQNWRKFVSTIQAAVVAAGGHVYAVAYGRGEWEGIAEDNAVVTFGGANYDDLRGRLLGLARAFEQDAIALVLGTSELVSA